MNIFEKDLQRGVGVILMPHDRSGLWLSRRKPRGRFYDNYFQTPGGEVNAGESDSEAASRELMEETGVSLYPNMLHFICRGRYRRFEGDLYIGTQFVAFTVQSLVNREPEKQTDWQLVKWDDLDVDWMMPSTVDAIIMLKSKEVAHFLKYQP